MRSGAPLVAAGWAFFLVAGAIFAKFTDGWNAVNPSPVRSARYGYSAVSWAGGAGVVLGLFAAAMVAPAVGRLVRRHEWRTVRTAVHGALIADGVVVSVTIGGAIWANHLGSYARNGGLVSYEMFFVLWAISGVVAIALSTSAVIAVGRRLTLSDLQLRALSVVAVVLSLMMFVIVIGMILWWGSEARYSPELLRNGIGNGVLLTSGTTPPALIVCGGLMIVGLVVAGRGVLRVARAFPHRMSVTE